MCIHNEMSVLCHHAVVTYNCSMSLCAGVGGDEEVFADGKVQHIGQIIGIIVAESQPLAQRAANVVNVTYEDLPSIITIEV